MARIVKTAVGKPLASSAIMEQATFPHGVKTRGANASSVRLSVEAEPSARGRARAVSLDMDRDEALRIACWIARVCNRRFVDGMDLRRPWQALRDLADVLEP